MTATSPGMQGGKRERKVWSQRPHSLLRRGEERECRFSPSFFHIRKSGRRRLGFFLCVALRVCCSYGASKCSGWPLKERRPRVCVVGGGGGPPYSSASAEGKNGGGMNRSFTPKYEQKWETFVRPKNGEEKKIVLHIPPSRHFTAVSALVLRIVVTHLALSLCAQ